MSNQETTRTAFTMTEMIAVVTILGIVAAIAVPRFGDGNFQAKQSACHSQCREIEIQAEIYHHNTGRWPASNLSSISGDIAYFPYGAPVCPVDGSVYTINSNGQIVGHEHK